MKHDFQYISKRNLKVKKVSVFMPKYIAGISHFSEDFLFT